VAATPAESWSIDPDLAIAAITQAIRQRLQAALNRAGDLGGEVRTERPDKMTDTGAPVVNLYLYQLNLNPFMRNNDIEPEVRRGPVSGTGVYPVAAEQVRVWRVPLKLLYLLSFYGDERTLVPQRLLAVCVAAMHRWPVIDAKAVAAAAASLGETPPPDPPEDYENVNVIFSNMSLDDIHRLWTSFKGNYALSVCYLAETAIVSARPQTSPVDLVLDIDLDLTALPPGQSIP
jgi:Pvc16 N-terminal domain